MIGRIIAKGQGLPDPIALGEGATMLEVQIPGNKVGLVIGKNGETIKQLQVTHSGDMEDGWLLSG